MRYLSAADIGRRVRPELVLGAVEEAYRAHAAGGFLQPDRIHADHGGGTLLLMPCFAAGAFGTKLVSLFPGNPGRGLPVLMGLMVLNDGETGRPLAILDGARLTAHRTGAVGALSLKYLAPPGASTLGIIGAGVQGFHQALYAARVRPIRRIAIYDLDAGLARRLAERLAAADPALGPAVRASAAEVVAESEMVITATTSDAPVLPDDAALLRGRHFVAIGSYKPSMRELPPSLFPLLEMVFVDTPFAVEESGDIAGPLREGRLARERVVSFSRVVAGEIDPEPLRRGTTLFKGVGMALFDLFAGRRIFEAAEAEGWGTALEP